MNRAKRYFINVLLGLIGGFLAFLTCMIFYPHEEGLVKQSAHLKLAEPVFRQASNVAGEAEVGAERVDLRYAAGKAVPGVVHVRTIQETTSFLNFFFGRSKVVTEDVPLGTGSGVIISEDGYVVTNSHVIRGADKVIVTLNDKREFIVEVVAQDRDTDLALLKIEGKNLPYLEYGDSDVLSLGEWVLAVGNPYNLTSTVTAGIISAKSRGLGLRGKMGIESFLQTDAAVNPGNSGGALVNIKGELVGINTLIQSPTGAFSGYAFAIPVNIVRKVVSDLKEYGKVQRAVIGIMMGELTPAFAEEIGVKEKSGIYVAEVLKGSAAEKGGVKKEDIIQKINDFPILTIPQLHEQLAKYNPGDKITLAVKRRGVNKNIDIILQDAYGNAFFNPEKSGDILGAVVEPISNEDRYKYRLDSGIKIKELRDGKFKAVGLDVGHIIIKINNHVIYDENELRKAIDAVTDGGVFITALSPQGRVEYYAFSLLN